MDLLDIEFSQPDPECFLVKDSQEETQELNDPVKMLEKLPALRRIVSQEETCKKAIVSATRTNTHSTFPVKSSPRKRGLKSISQTFRSQVQQMDEDADQDTNGSGEAPGNGDDGHQEAGGNEAAAGGGEAPVQGGGAGDGGDGGDDGEGGNHGADLPADADSDDDQHQEEDNPSSSDSSSVPHLVPVPSTSSAFTPPRHIPGHYEGQQSSPRASTSATLVGEDAPPRDDSESEGGISNASTAVVSDTEGHGQIISSRVRRVLGTSPARSPGHARSPRAPTDAPDTSSAMSTLSSYTSSSASEDTFSETSPRAKGTPRKRAAGRRLQEPPPKRVRVDTSSSTTSTETKTSTSSTKTPPTTDTSTDTSGAGDKVAAGDRSLDVTVDKTLEDISSSQRDMFCDEPGTSKEEEPHDDGPPVSTPAELLESLHFSGHQSSHISSGQIQSLGYVPASQETYSSSIPFLLPGSPTANVSEDESVSDSFRAELGDVRKLTKKSSYEIREERRQMPPPSSVATEIEELPSTTNSARIEAEDDKIEAESCAPIAEPSLHFTEAQPIPSLSIPESSSTNGSSNSSDKSKGTESAEQRGDIVDKIDTDQGKNGSDAWHLEYQASEQTASIKESEIPGGSVPRVGSPGESQRPVRGEGSSPRKIPKSSCASSLHNAPSQSSPSQPEIRLPEYEGQSTNIGRESVPVEGKEFAEKTSDSSQASRVKLQSQKLAPEISMGFSWNADPPKLIESDSQKMHSSVMKDHVYSQSTPRSQQRPSTQDSQQHGKPHETIEQSESLKANVTLETPERPRLTQEHVEDHDAEISQPLLLQLSQTQQTQSQYSVGVTAILQKLDDVDDEVSQELTPCCSTGPGASQPRGSEQIAEVSLPIPTASQGEDIEIPSMAFESQPLRQHDEDNTTESKDVPVGGRISKEKHQSRSTREVPHAADMAETEEDDTQGSVSLFSLNRPNVQTRPDEASQENLYPAEQSVFSRVKQAQEREVVHIDDQSEDPFAFAGSQSQSTEKATLPSPAEFKRKKKAAHETTQKNSTSEGYHSFCTTDPSSAAKNLAQTQPMNAEETVDDVILLSESTVNESIHTVPNEVEYTNIRGSGAAEVIEISSQSSHEKEETSTFASMGSQSSEMKEKKMTDNLTMQGQTSQSNTSDQYPKGQRKHTQRKTQQIQRTQSQRDGKKLGSVKVLVEETESSSSKEKSVVSDAATIPETCPLPATPRDKTEPDMMEISDSGIILPTDPGSGLIKSEGPPSKKTPQRRRAQKRLKSSKRKQAEKNTPPSVPRGALDTPVRPFLRPQDTLIQASKSTTAGGSKATTTTAPGGVRPSQSQPPATTSTSHQPDDKEGNTGRNTEAADGGDGNPSSSQTQLVYSRVIRVESIIRQITFIQEDSVNGRVVNRRVIKQKCEPISSNTDNLEDSMSTPSPSRKTQSLTSGDLADISSLSRSTSNKTGTGSSFTSPHVTLGSSSSHSGGPSIHSAPIGSNVTPPVMTSSGPLSKDLPAPPVSDITPKSGPEPSTSEFPGREGSRVEMKSPVPAVIPAESSGSARLSSGHLPPSGEQTVIKSTSANTSSSSYIKLADLDTSAERMLSKRKSSSTTLSSIRSESLFSSTTSPEGISALEDPNHARKDIEFQKPKPPSAPKRLATSDVKADLSKIHEESPRVAGLDKDKTVLTPKQHVEGKGKTDKGKGRGKGYRDGKESAKVGQFQSPLPTLNPSTPQAHHSPETVIGEGTPVFAMWKDKYYYHGKTTGFESQLKYAVNFDDGMSLKVTKSNVIPSCILSAGHSVMADDGDYVAALVVNINETQDGREYQVEFDDGKTKKLPIEKLSLSPEQFLALKNPSIRSFGKTDISALVSDDLSAIVPEDTSKLEVEKKVKEQKVTNPREKAVYAMYKDKYFYPGYLVDEQEGKCTIAFEDGDVYQVRSTDVIHCDLLPLEQAVYAMGEDKDYSKALIVEVFDGTLSDWGYRVQFMEGGQQKRVGRDQVILSSEQASVLRQDRTSIDTTPKVADVSLNNLMDGKRRRGTPQTCSPSTQTPRTPTTSSPSTRVRAQRKLPWTTGGKSWTKRNFSTVEPKATSTPTPKRYKMLSKSQIHDSEAPSPLTYESPKEKRSSPRKFRQELFSEVKGPVPHIGSTIFQGKCFFLTYVDTIAAPQDSEIRSGANLESDESSLEGLKEFDEVPFDKEHIKKQLIKGGGTVLDTFDRDQIKLYSSAFLVSNSYHRTVKYFHCLAAGIACVSHVWVRDCCAAGTLCDHIPYMLPAGFSIESDKVIEWRTSPVMPLKGRHIVVSTTNKMFVKTWSDILRSAGCFVDNDLPEELDAIDVVVSDRKIDDNICYTALQADIPIVSSEWVIQSLITGKQAPFDGHGKYQHDHDDSSKT